jgi:hypothetical protein
MDEGTGKIQKHLLDGEDVEDRFVGNSWAWVCTDQRLLKHREKGAGEELRDISYEEISGISLTHQGRNKAYLAAAGVLVLLGILPYLVAIPTAPSLSIFAVLLAGVPIYLWTRSESSYFEFQGSGIIQQNPSEWRIDKTSIEDEQRLNEFIQSVRGRL